MNINEHVKIQLSPPPEYRNWKHVPPYWHRKEYFWNTLSLYLIGWPQILDFIFFSLSSKRMANMWHHTQLWKVSWMSKKIIINHKRPQKSIIIHVVFFCIMNCLSSNIQLYCLIFSFYIWLGYTMKLILLCVNSWKILIQQ